MNARDSVFILRLVLGLVAGGYSLVLVVSQFQGSAHPALLLLGVAELAAAILFLISRTLRLGGAALIIIFALAAIFHVVHHEYSVASLVVYGAAAWAAISNGGGVHERR
jgi:hypothetical protein